MALATAKKPEELNIKKDIGPAFDRQSSLIALGDLATLRKEYGGAYLQMAEPEFRRLRNTTILRQAELLSLHDPQIDAAIDNYRKKNAAETGRLENNIQLALANPLVKEAIGKISDKNTDAKGYTRLSVEWGINDFLKDIAKVGAGAAGGAAAGAWVFGVGAIPGALAGVALTLTGCGRDGLAPLTLEQEKPDMEMKPMPTREHAVAERKGLLGVELGEPVSPFWAPIPGTNPRAMVFGGDELPLLRDQFVEGAKGDVRVTQKLFVQTRVMFNIDQKKLQFAGMHAWSFVEFSDPLALKPGSGFTILGRNAKVVRVSSTDLVVEDSKGKQYTLGSTNTTNDFLGMAGVRAYFVSLDGGKSPRAIVLSDTLNNKEPTDPPWVTSNQLLLLNTFGLNLKGMDLKDDEYGYVRIGPPPPPLQNFKQSGIIGLYEGAVVQLSAEISVVGGTFVVDGHRITTFYQATLGTTNTPRFLPIYQLNNNWYLPQSPIKYESPGGGPYSITSDPLEVTSVLFQENSGRPGADYVRLYIQGRIPHVYSPTSRPPEEGGTLGKPNPPLGYAISNTFITFRGSYIETSRTVGSGHDNVVEYSPATRVGNAVVQVTQ